MASVEPQVVVRVRTHPADKVRATKERTPTLPFDTGWRPPGLDGIAKLTLSGNTLASMVGPRIVTARLDTSLDEPMTLTLELWDKGRELLTSGLLDTKLTLKLEHHTLVMTRVGKLGDLLHLEFEDGNVAALRKQTGPLKVTRGTTNRIDFVKKLLEEKGAPKLRWYIDSGQPGQVTVEKNPLALDNHQERKPGPLAATTVKNAPATADQLDNLRVVLTHLFSRGATRDELICVVMAGTAESRWLNSATHFDGTSEGIFQQQNVHAKGPPPSRWYGGGTDRIAAADLFYNALKAAIARTPQLLSSEKHLLIQAVQGSATSNGSNYSPWLEESQKTVSAFDRAYGGSQSVMATALYEFRRGGLDGSPEDSWECLGRLADEVQYRRFIVEGVFYFLPDELLVGTGPRLVLHEQSDGMLTPIDFDMDEGVDPQTASFSIHTEKWYAPPGTCIELTDLGPGNGVWLVSKATSDLLQPNAQDITLIRPRAVLTEPPADQTLDLDTSSGGGRSTSGNRSLQSGQVVPDETMLPGYGVMAGSPKSIIDLVALPTAAQAGLTKTAAQNDIDNAHHTHLGARSDHAGPPGIKWATDLGIGPDIRGGTNETGAQLGDAVAAALAARFGIPWPTGQTSQIPIASVTRDGFRYQLIWRYEDSQAGNHYTHVHFGVRRV